MTLTLDLTPEVWARLSRYAETTGKKAETAAAEWLATLPEPTTPPAQVQRIAGLGAGNILWIADDFDEPLPDEYWDSPVFPELTTPEKTP